MEKEKHKESSNSKETKLGDAVMGKKVDRFVLSQECWAITLEGILALLFGTFVLIVPGITIGWLLIFFLRIRICVGYIRSCCLVSCG